MKRTIGVLFFVLIVAGSYAQEQNTDHENRPNLVISANLYGSASLLSLNIERLFFIKPAFSLTANMGIGFNVEFNLSSNAESENYTILPHHITALYGRNKSFLEYGIGGSAVFSEEDKSSYLLYPILGYRAHPFKNPGISFRAWILIPFGQQATIESYDILFVPFGGSIGIAF
jgi:hypothetical protein